jgi:ShK domain-like
MRIPFLLSLWLWWIVTLGRCDTSSNGMAEHSTSDSSTTTEQQQECVMQQDGTCLTTQNDGAEPQVPPDHDNSATCPDLHETCEYWASLGECNANPKYMLKNCPKSCHVCQWTKSQIDREVRKRLGLTTDQDDTKHEDEVVNLTEYSCVQSGRGSQIATNYSKHDQLHGTNCIPRSRPCQGQEGMQKSVSSSTILPISCMLSTQLYIPCT